MKVHHNTLKKAKKVGIQLVVRDNEICAIQVGAPDIVLASGPQGNVVLDQAIARMNGKLTGTPGSRAKLKEAFKNGATVSQAVKAVKKTKEELIQEKAIEIAKREGMSDEDIKHDIDQADGLHESFYNSAREELGFSNEDEDEEETADEGEEETGDDRGNSIVKRKYKAMYRPYRYTCGDELAQMIKSHLTVATKDGKEALDLVALKRFAMANDCWQDRYALLNPGQARMNVGNRLRAKVKHGHTIKWV